MPNLWLGRGHHKHLVVEGYIEEFRLWNTVRSQSEIRAHMDVGLGGSEEGLLGYWPMDEGSGVMAMDRSRDIRLALNAHLLGRPLEMWVKRDVVMAFTKTECSHCNKLHLAPVPLLHRRLVSSFEGDTPEPSSIATVGANFNSSELRAPVTGSATHSEAWMLTPSFSDADYYSVVTPDEWYVRPVSGPMSGGTVVLLRGRNFIDSRLLGCRFQGTIPAMGGQKQGNGLVSGLWINSTAIECVSPPALLVGPTLLFITNDGETFSEPVSFTYEPMVPIVTGVSLYYTGPAGVFSPPASYCPVRSPLTGGTTVVVHGRGFQQSEELLLFRMGEMPALPVKHWFNSTTVLIETPPFHTRFHSGAAPRQIHAERHDNFGLAPMVPSWGPNPSAYDSYAVPPTATRNSPFPLREHVRTRSEGEGGTRDYCAARDGADGECTFHTSVACKVQIINDERFDPCNKLDGPDAGRNDFELNTAYQPWGQGKPFDCSRDEMGTRCYRPSFNIRVSNDGGRTWSLNMNYTTTHDTTGAMLTREGCVFYSDLIVSKEGDDETGDGTLTRPYRTLLKAAGAAHPVDRIVLQEGDYHPSELHDTAIAAAGKKLEIIHDPPTRMDQGHNGPSPKYCRCADDHSRLCACKNQVGLPSIGKTPMEYASDESESLHRDLRSGGLFPLACGAGVGTW